MGLQETLKEHPEHRYEFIESPDDGGWYIKDWVKDQVSRDIYPSQRSARLALDSSIVWEK